MPRSSVRTFHKLRTNKPAPIRSSTESAAWTIVNVVRRLDRRPPPSRAPVRSASVPVDRVDRIAGRMPTRRPVASANAAEAASTRGLTGDAVHSTAEKRAWRASPPITYVTAMPAIAPPKARRIDSIRSSLTILKRLAPSAARIATSRCRRLPRASSRLAMFAQAINRTSAATQVSHRRTRISVASLPAPFARSDATRMCPCAVYASPPVYARRWAAVASTPACSKVTPGFRRPMTCSHWAFHVVAQVGVMRVERTWPGTQTSTRPISAPVKPAGATPITANDSSPRVMVFPITSSAPPNQLVHEP